MIKQSIMRSSSRTLTTKWKKPCSSYEKSHINGLIIFSVESLDFLKKDFPWLAEFRQWQKKDSSFNIVIALAKKVWRVLSLFIKVASLKACYFIKKILQHRCFPMKTVKFWRTPILKNICERLLLTY